MNLTKAKDEKAVFVQYLSIFGRTVFIAVLSMAKVAGVYPFGLSYAAAFAEENMLAAFLGLAAGLIWNAENAVKYILAAAVYGVMVYVRKFEDKGVKAVALGTSLIFASLVDAIAFGLTPSKFLIMLPEAFAAGGLYCLFANIKKEGAASYAAELLLFGASLCAIYGVRIPYLDINIAVFAAMLISMSISYSCGVPISVLSGAALGFMTFLNTPSAVEMSGLFAVSALFGALLSKTGKSGVSIGFLSGATVCVLLIGRLGVLSMADIFGAPIIFLIIPQKWAVKIGSRANRNLAEEKSGEDIAERIKTVAKAVEDLGSGVLLTSKKEEAADAYSGIFDRVCEGCKQQEVCFADGGREPQNNVRDLKAVMDRDGYLDFSNMPKNIGRTCVRSERFSGEFLHIAELKKQNELLHGELDNDRELVAKQYGEISNIIKGLSKTEKEEGEPRYSVSVSVFQEPKNKGEENGDTVVHFQKGNKYFVILCDGMGSGVAAREISGLTAQFFAEFFGAGIEKSIAVNMINSALSLNADRESFSSADILEIDLENGVAEFMKIGSAQSFIKRGNEIEEISSSALPIGILESINAAPQKCELVGGDEILMMSDGIGENVSGFIKNGWIKKQFLCGKGDAEERARRMVESAKAKSVFRDDMTAIIIKIEKEN